MFFLFLVGNPSILCKTNCTLYFVTDVFACHYPIAGRLTADATLNAHRDALAAAPYHRPHSQPHECHMALYRASRCSLVLMQGRTSESLPFNV
jgi:hypothetical protein